MAGHEELPQDDVVVGGPPTLTTTGRDKPSSRIVNAQFDSWAETRVAEARDEALNDRAAIDALRSQERPPAPLRLETTQPSSGR